MRIRLRKWGNSIGIRLPKIYAIAMGMEVGKEVEMAMKDHKLVMQPAETLEELLKKISPENIHGETDTGEAVGKEIW